MNPAYLGMAISAVTLLSTIGGWIFMHGRASQKQADIDARLTREVALLEKRVEAAEKAASEVKNLGMAVEHLGERFGNEVKHLTEIFGLKMDALEAEVRRSRRPTRSTKPKA